MGMLYLGRMDQEQMGLECFEWMEQECMDLIYLGLINQEWMVLEYLEWMDQEQMGQHHCE